MNEEICNWMFNKCPINNVWRASKKEHYNEVFNDYNSKNVIKSSEINVLIELINKTNGNIIEMNKLIKQ